MTTTTIVPLNTMLADLDESLRGLLQRELQRHGFDGVEIAFDAPAKEWSATLNAPTVNAFLYDLRESKDHRPVEWELEQSRGAARERRPPLIVEASFALTAWARAVEDEHRLLSQVLAVLYAYPELPEEVLAGALRDTSAQHPLRAKVGQPKGEGKADFWSSIGGQYKASLDYVIALACEPGTSLERGPEVRTQTVRVRDADGARANVIELHRVGGTVRDGGGEPLANAWVAIPELGLWTASGPDGRFRFERVGPGAYRCLARAADGGEADGELVVPGPGVDIALGAAKAAARRRR
ncbi:MAG TPA: Pvc16 family protein [Solirubrobacteraceae bacterium]|jgi:hypothetical protein|nr:Pvc16 family protein [Solirubrobacteraceae bacterium]